MRTLLFLSVVMMLSSTAIGSEVDCKLEPKKKGDKWGYVDQNNKWVIKPNFAYANSFNWGLAVVRVSRNKRDYYGLIDCAGNFVLEPQYTDITQNDFNENLLVKKDDGKIGIIKKDGSIVVGFDYDRIRMYYSLFLASRPSDGKFDVLKTDGKLVGSFDEVLYFKDSVYMTRVGDKFGLLDYYGNELFPPIADYLGTTYFKNIRSWSSNLFMNGTITYTVKGFAGVMDKTGKVLIDHKTSQFQFINDSRCGLRRAKKNERYGFINDKGVEIIKAIYEYADEFYNGVAAVKINGKYGYIDTTGKTVLPFVYDHAYSPYTGVAEVVQDGVKKKIDMQGNWVNKPAPQPVKPKCLQSCTDCGGTGTRMTSTANKCGYCDGTGRSGYNFYTIGGRSYSEPKACSRCDGSGRSFGSNTTFEYCKTCNQTGCLKFE